MSVEESERKEII